MPQAVVDPDELRQFARALKKFNSELRAQMSHVSNQLNSLGTTWRDQEHKKFCARFDEQTKFMMRFLEESDTHVPYLMRKAEQIDDYLQG